MSAPREKKSIDFWSSHLHWSLYCLVDNYLLTTLQTAQKNTLMVWSEDCQKAFKKIKTYVLSLMFLYRQYLDALSSMYLAIHDYSVGCVLDQDDETGKERAIYYLNQKI